MAQNPCSRRSRVLSTLLLLALGLVATPAHALIMTLDEVTSTTNVPDGPEGVASFGGKFYVPQGDNCGGFLQPVCQVFVYNLTGGNLTKFGSFQVDVGEPRGIDFDPTSGKMYVSALDVGAPFGRQRGIAEFTVPSLTDIQAGTASATRTMTLDLSGFTTSQLTGFDQVEALSVFRDPLNNLKFLLGEEGEDVDPEPAGGVFLVDTLGSVEELLRVPFSETFDDVSGFDLLNLAFNPDNSIDRANTTLLMVDDGSGGASSIFILNLLGECIEALGGLDCGSPALLEALIGTNYRDPEGVDYTDGVLALWFEDDIFGVVTGTLTSQVPEPASALLLGLGVAGIAARRRSS